MKLICTLFLVLCAAVHFSAQMVLGIVVDEENNPLSAVLVFNAKTEQREFTNTKGEFSISAFPNQELRFVRKGYERSSKMVNQSDFATPFTITLNRNTAEIEEVKITYQPTGNLEKDLKNYSDAKPVAKLKAETAKYIRADSTPEVLAPKPGEFVQPVGPGFSVGAVDNQWDDVDFMQFLTEYLGQEFFIQDLKLKPTEIQPFIYYIFRNFDRKDVLFRGNATTADISRFINESHKKLEPYRNNLTNDPPKKRRRSFF